MEESTIEKLFEELMQEYREANHDFDASSREVMLRVFTRGYENGYHQALYDKKEE